MVETKERTLSVDPQQRPGLFPISEGAAFGEPHCGAPVTRIARNAVIYGGIWGRKPFHRLYFAIDPMLSLRNFRSHYANVVCDLSFRLLNT